MPQKSTQSIPYNEQAVRKVAASKHEAQSAYVIRGVPGLVLTCFPSGTASFSVRYTVAGRRRKESIGQWGVVSLADARTRALEIGAGAAAGRDVLAKEAKDKARPTLRKLWEVRKDKDTARAPKTMHEHRLLLEAEVFPKFGNRYADEITTDELADLLERIEGQSGDKARRLKSTLSSLYRFGQKRRLVRINPLAGLAFSYRGKERNRVLTDAEMRRLWLAIGTASGLTEAMRNLLRLAILTGQRNSEIAGLEVAEVKGLDTETPRLHIPGRRMKRKTRDQHVPLSRQAAMIVRTALASSSNGLHVFEGAPNGRREGKWRQGHIVNEAVSRAMAKVVAHAGLTNVVLHDMRKCVTSWLIDHVHAPEELLDVILHHQRKGVTSTHYNFATYEGQVRPLLQAWADHISHLAGEGQGASEAGNVVALAKPPTLARA